jgi:copper chaperone
MATTTATTSHFQVIGMTCDHCTRAVAQELREVGGVTDVDVRLDTGAVTVTHTQPLDRDEVAAAVDEAGYELAG